MNLSQLLALVQLRFQLSLNQIRKGGTVNSILFTIVSIAMTFFVISSLVSAILFGIVWMKREEASSILTVWNFIVAAFLVMWTFHLMNRLQQSDVISIDKLLHLPITFHGAFLLNFMSSFANMPLLTLAPIMIGLAIAMPFARGWPALVAIPLTLTFIFMVSAVTHLLRGWLAEKMQNKRTRGFLMAVIPLFCVGLFVAISKLIDKHDIYSVLSEIPMGWLPSGIIAAESGNWISGMLGSLSMTAIGCASLYFAFNSSMRKFTGSDLAFAPTKSKSVSARNWLDSKMFSSMPYVSDPVAAVALGTMQGMRRSPEVYAALVPAVAMAIFGSPFLIGMEGYVIADWLVNLLLPSLIVVALIGFPAFMFSTFSYDRDGFRAFILSPIKRKDILLGKNLAVAIPTLVMGWFTMIFLQCFIPVGPLWFLGSLINLPASFLLLCIGGNVISIFCAVGLKRGSMQPVKARVIPVVALYVGILGGPLLAILPTMTAFIIAQVVERRAGFAMGWLYVLLSVISLGLSILVYRKSLDGLGKCLWNRESEILDVVANIPE